MSDLAAIAAALREILNLTLYELWERIEAALRGK